MEDQVNSTAANLMGSDNGANKKFTVLSKFLGDGIKGFGAMEKVAAKIEKHFEKVWDIYKKMGLVDGTAGGGRLGMGTFSKTEKVIGSAALAGAAVYSMMPSTSAAVSQRLAANTMVGLTGMGPNQLIRAANRGIGLGATSVGAPTQTAMSLMFQGGMSIANPYIYSNIFRQVGGLSAMSGMSNQQVAQALSQVNSMNFLRTGTMVRNQNGSLAAPNQMINRLYSSMYGGQNITREQAALANNPYTASYRTIAQVSGGNAELQSLLTAGIQFRAIAGRELTAKDMRNPEKVFKMLGLDPKNDPMAANLRNIFAKNKLLEESQQGLVSGYTKSLDANASLTNQFTKLAEVSGGLYDALANLKGFLETFPAAGSVGGTVSGIASNAFGMAAGMYMMRGFGGGGFGGKGGAKGKGPGGFGGVFAGKAGLLRGGALAVGAMAAGYGADRLNQNFKGSDATRDFGMGMAKIGQYALTGAAIGSMIPVVGTGIGAAIGTGFGALMHGGQVVRGIGDAIGGESDAVGQTSMSGKGKDLALQMPVPKGSPISSHYGPREEAAKKAKEKGLNISSFHRGTDFAVPVGTPVTAAADGVVTEMGLHKEYGNYVIIRHGSKSTLYGHLSKFATSRGRKVKAGDLIAYSGGAKGAPGSGNSGGPHLHFEVRDNGGVGAQGRENPENFFGKSFKFLKNMAVSGINLVKRVSNKLFGTNLSWNNVSKGEGAWDFGSSHEMSRYNTPSLSAAIAAALSSGAPLSVSDLQGRSGKFKTNITMDGEKTTISGRVNNQDNRVSGDRVGMAGGDRAGLMKLLYRGGFRGKKLETAFAVALAESGGRAQAKNFEGRDRSYGLFQINMINDDPKSPNMGTKRLKQFGLQKNEQLYDPMTNIRAAYEISNGGKWWGQWGAYNNGSFVKYLDDAVRAAKKAKIPTYHQGIDRVPKEQLAVLDKDEMVIPPNLANQIRNKTVPAGGNVNIKVDMQVNIAKSGVQEAEYMFDYFKTKLEKELKNNQMGTF